MEDKKIMQLIQINGIQAYKDLVEKNPNVVLEFFATWCPHCKAMQPIVEEMAKNRSDVVFVQVDVDRNEELSEAYGIEGTPTFYFVKNGDPVLQDVGEMPYSDLAAFVEKGCKK